METNGSKHPNGMTLESCIRLRHSVRFYRRDPVDHQVLLDCLNLARLAPSNSNIQNWRIHFATGPRLARVVSALQAEHARCGPDVAALPEEYRRLRAELGQLLYGEKGYDIAQEDTKGRERMSARNYEFFRAPVGAVITMHKDLGQVDALSVGLFLQTFMLALTERGLGSCLQVSIASYPDVLRREFKLGEEQFIFCGMALGWPDENSPVNKLVTSREDVDRFATFHEE